MDLLPKMKSRGEEPLIVIPINGTYVLAVYQGGLSEYDLLLRYRQKMPNGKWTYIRTPKHIHWAVDILIKMHSNEEATKRFVDFLIEYWHSVTPIRSDEQRSTILDTATLLHDVNEESVQYQELSGKGEYSVKFLLLIAKLLMVQEKTNREDAYMFKKVLEALKDGNDIFGIISTATHH